MTFPKMLALSMKPRVSDIGAHPRDARQVRRAGPPRRPAGARGRRRGGRGSLHPPRPADGHRRSRAGHGRGDPRDRDRVDAGPPHEGHRHVRQDGRLLAYLRRSRHGHGPGQRPLQPVPIRRAWASRSRPPSSPRSSASARPTSCGCRSPPTSRARTRPRSRSGAWPWPRSWPSRPATTRASSPRSCAPTPVRRPRRPNRRRRARPDRPWRRRRDGATQAIPRRRHRTTTRSAGS